MANIETKNMYSIKMRASNSGGKQHISGAERLVEKSRLDEVCRQLLERALYHVKGEADFINIKIEKVAAAEILKLAALPVKTIETISPREGRERIKEFLLASGITNAEDVLNMMSSAYGMRGAMLLNVDTMERLEPDLERGIRATFMDAADDNEIRPIACLKNHFREALVLATKVANQKNIIGELCLSDDPDYVTGYFASKELGYLRITCLKEQGSQDGGRIFLFRGSKGEARECIRYLEQQKVLVSILGGTDE